jgi:hypothetical protein
MAQQISTAEELNTLLTAWEGDVGAIRSNITLLKNTLSYRFLHGKELKGTTSEQLPPAFDAVKRMDGNWAKLQTFVSDARAAYGKLPRWGQKKAVEDIAEGFSTDSITMEVRDIPLAQRTATSGDKLVVKASPTKLKDQINTDFMSAKKVLLAVDEKWEKLNAGLAAARATVTDLQARFEAAALGDATELDNVVRRFNSIDTKYKSDPLGCPEDIPAYLRPYVTSANQRLEAEESRILREQEAVATKLETAKEKLEELKALKLRALELHAKAMAEIDNPQSHGLTAPGSTKRLGEWLATLEQALTDKRFDAVTQGVNDWYIEYNDLNRSLHEVISANERVNERRRKLVQRLATAKASYEAQKAAIGESKSLAKFDEVATAALSGKIHLEEAERAVESYEVKLGELIARIGTKK